MNFYNVMKGAAMSEWGKLSVKREAGGLRHYLDGQPVHCGTSLKLQHFTLKADTDGNERSVPLPEGSFVRYEASQDGKEISASLHTGVGGHEFVARLEPWMRFRWPERSR